MNTTNRLLELKAARDAASVAAWDAAHAYNAADDDDAADALAAAWADYLLAADTYHKADAAYWDTYLAADRRATLNSAWDAEKDLDQ